MAKKVTELSDTDVLAKIGAQIKYGLNDKQQDTKSFKAAAEQANSNIKSVIKDLYNVINAQNKSVNSVFGALDNNSSGMSDTTKKIDSTNSLLEQSIIAQNQTLSEIKKLTEITRLGVTQQHSLFGALGLDLTRLGKQTKVGSTLLGRFLLGGALKGVKGGNAIAGAIGAGAIGIVGAAALYKGYNAARDATASIREPSDPAAPLKTFPAGADRPTMDPSGKTEGSSPPPNATFKKEGDVKESKGSWFSQFQGKYSWVDKKDDPNSNYSGLPDSTPGIALRDKSTMGHYFNVQAPNGKTLLLRQVDLGPHEKTGRDIDINAAAAEAFGYSPNNFPTDGNFKYQYSGKTSQDATKQESKSTESSATSKDSGANTGGLLGGLSQMGADMQQQTSTGSGLLGGLSQMGANMQQQTGDSGSSSSDATQVGGGGSSGAVDIAAGMVGKTMSQNSDEIKGFISNGGVGLNPSADAWCAAFVNSALAQSGVKGTDNQVANGFQTWGTEVPANSAKKGDVVIITRGKGAGETGGHVGLATGNVDGNKIEIIAGNTSKSVKQYYVPIDQVMVRRAGASDGAPPVNAGTLKSGGAGASGAGAMSGSSGSSGGMSMGGNMLGGGGPLGNLGGLLGMIPGLGKFGGMINSVIGGLGGLGGGAGNSGGDVLSDWASKAFGLEGLMPSTSNIGKTINDRAIKASSNETPGNIFNKDENTDNNTSSSSSSENKAMTQNETKFFTDDDDWLKQLGFHGYYPQQTKGIA